MWISQCKKKEKFKDLLLEIKNKYICRMYLIQLARFMRNMVASFPAVTFGPFHYRNLEKDKIGVLNITIITLIKIQK